MIQTMICWFCNKNSDSAITLYHNFSKVDRLCCIFIGKALLLLNTVTVRNVYLQCLLAQSTLQGGIGERRAEPGEMGVVVLSPSFVTV